MMDRFTFAQEGYDALQRKTLSRTPRGAGREYAKWIGECVVPVVEDLATHADFRNLARWPLEHLQAGARHQERQLVDRVDQLLVALAKALVGYANRRQVRQCLMEMGPMHDSLKGVGKGTTVPNSRQVVKITANGALEDVQGVGRRLLLRRQLTSVPPRPESNSRSGRTEELPDGMDAVQIIASRPWEDLVSMADYLVPSKGLHLRHQPCFQPVELVPMLEHELRRLGEHVSGMLLRRVDYFWRDLDRFWGRCSSAAHQLNDKGKVWQAVSAAHESLHGHMRELRAQLTRGSEARLRESAVVLVQAYAGFHPKPDLNWLALLPEQTVGTEIYRLWLVNHDEFEIAARIALALADLGKIYHAKPSPEEIMEERARTHALVLGLGMGVRYLYWHSQRVDAQPLRGVLWETLWTLAERAVKGRAMDHSDVDEDLTPHGLTCRINRLKIRLPVDLAKAIKEGDADQTYRLRLPATQIHLESLLGEEET